MKWGKDVYLFGGLCLIGVLLIFALSWQTDPNLKGLPFIPSWLYDWTDDFKNSTIRTGVPFFIISIIIGTWFCVKMINWRYYLITFFILFVVLITAELGQYFIPSRNLDFKDIIWGIIGNLLGLGFMYLISLSIKALRN